MIIIVRTGGNIMNCINIGIFFKKNYLGRCYVFVGYIYIVFNRAELIYVG